MHVTIRLLLQHLNTEALFFEVCKSKPTLINCPLKLMSFTLRLMHYILREDWHTLEVVHDTLKQMQSILKELTAPYS